MHMLLPSVLLRDMLLSGNACLGGKQCDKIDLYYYQAAYCQHFSLFIISTGQHIFFSATDITCLPFPWPHLSSPDRQQLCLPVVIADHRHRAAVQRTRLKDYEVADDVDDGDDGHNDNDDDQKVIADDGGDNVNDSHRADTGVVHPPQAHVWRSCMI